MLECPNTAVLLLSMSTYDGEPIAQPEPRLTRSQQLELLLWHPFFTGLCPQCRYPFEAMSDRASWDCPQCGWKDEARRSHSSPA